MLYPIASQIHTQVSFLFQLLRTACNRFGKKDVAVGSHAPGDPVGLPINEKGLSTAKVGLHPTRAVQGLHDIAGIDVLIHQALAMDALQA